MKQKDLALIIIVVIVSGALSFTLGNLLFAPKTTQLQAAYVDPVSTDFTYPSNKYFNTNSVDLTELVHVGDNTNGAPFGSAKQ